MKKLLIVLLFALALVVSAQPDARPYLGINHEVIKDIPPAPGAQGLTGGIRLTQVQPNTPASKAGLLNGDILAAVEGQRFTLNTDSILPVFQRWLYAHKPGDVVEVSILRLEADPKFQIAAKEGDVDAFLENPRLFLHLLPADEILSFNLEKKWTTKTIAITLGSRQEYSQPPLPPVADTDLGRFTLPQVDKPLTEWQTWVDEVVERYQITDEFVDLRSRLNNIEAGGDGTRLPAIAEVHRNPFYLERYGRRFTDRLIRKRGEELKALFLNSDLTVFLTGNCPLLEDRLPLLENYASAADNKLKAMDEESFLKWFNAGGAALDSLWEIVFAPLPVEDRQFFEEHKFDLTDVFSQGIYIQSDDDALRFERNLRLLDIAGRVDLDKLFRAAYATGQFIIMNEDRVFNWMKAHSQVRSLETSWGRIGFGTTGCDRWEDQDYRFIYDPDGDDFYVNGVGSASSFAKPFGWIIDKKGNDAYQATAAGAQGCGMPGIGVLIDREGDDTYIGLKWAQGVGYLGVGVLEDFEGDDVYRGDEYVQGAALFGMGVVADVEGDDSYNASVYAQGLGLTRGLGMLLDFEGDDYGYCSGKQPTNYGTPGVFDAWSQGCGMGFRSIASGGVGLVVDAEGKDKWEAGNFSQGGGYYYGLGIFRGGRGDDQYIGSRYGQGFSAHQAAGLFLEDSGDDRYTTRHCVVSGLAWDECVSVFIDEGGDDHYDGGSGFSLGASAHNSFCFFLDKGGRDTYIYAPGPARAGGNDYHGGYSFSLFVDQGREEDWYSCDKVGNDKELAWPEFGVFRDGKGLPQAAGVKPEK